MDNDRKMPNGPADPAGGYVPDGTAPRSCDCVAAFVAGLQQAREFVMAAPTTEDPKITRLANAPGGFPRVADRAVDPDGDPDRVYCLYALRDAVLYWIDREISAATDA